MSGLREDIIASAVKFLQDPNVQASSLGKKVAFLESKGLTAQEIEESMARANGTSTSAATVAAPALPQQQAMMPYQGQVVMAPPPLPYKYDWKDMFIGAVVAGGFTYGLWQIAKNVVKPKLQWPTKEDLEMDKKKLDEQFEEIEKSITEVKSSASVVAKNVDDQTAHVKETLQSMSGVLDSIKGNDGKRDQELVDLKLDIEKIKSMIPELVEKNKEAQATHLNELQAEIKSLKTLMIARRPGPAGGSTPVSPAPVAPWNSVQYGSGSTQSTSSTTTTTTTTSGASDLAMNFLNTKTSIPAWQLAAQKPVVNSEPTPVEGSEPTNSA
ncbi:peroxisomal membrane protein pex14 [Entomortierella beljakovae]|nr:peroxisomal membrane protein pex14 [Entomortierella beljakovae]